MESNINSFWEILRIVLPALVVFLTAYFLFRDMLENAQRQREFEYRAKVNATVTPAKLQAYERLALLLERISPASLLVRVSPHDLVARDYHQLLLTTIRQEFEHNLSQQIYITPLLWETLKGARESLVGIINRSAEEVGEGVSALILSKKIVENYIDEDPQPIQVAMNELKKEVAHLL